uniref:Uncharacterized protein n=1 Tax=Candidatus Kentrum sp. LPFa TaxID=2126335 RepID=A0A450W0K2_9GAMM|nr:MAG: hypothetical protein BECKLPF1236A_GA0070988_100405 [Candidatus Kentron sp. LPFa]VFK27138.1 MAG: hypothetical protein BECKLPF1236C_GA0070990_100435 [Candidatus Kentron sp. LPFa]
MRIAQFILKSIFIALIGLFSLSYADPSSLSPEKIPDARSLQTRSRFRTATIGLPSGRTFPIRLLFSAAEITKTSIPLYQCQVML